MCPGLPGQLLIANMQGRVFEEIMHLLSSEEATNFKARRIALASAIKIELADGNRRESTCCPKTAADATISLSLEPSVYIVEYSDVNDLISVKCGWFSQGFPSDLKVVFVFNPGTKIGIIVMTLWSLLCFILFINLGSKTAMNIMKLIVIVVIYCLQRYIF